MEIERLDMMTHEVFICNHADAWKLNMKSYLKNLASSLTLFYLLEILYFLKPSEVSYWNKFHTVKLGSCFLHSTWCFSFVQKKKKSSGLFSPFPRYMTSSFWCWLPVFFFFCFLSFSLFYLFPSPSVFCLMFLFLSHWWVNGYIL